MHGNIFEHQFLVNEMHEGKLKTFVASTQRLPPAGGTTNVFIKELNDFIEVHYNSILCVVKPKPVR